METTFLHVFNIAVTAGWIVLAALALRLILRRRLPGWVKVALWGVVGARLLFPFSLESVLSLIPSAEPVPPTITTSPAPTVNVGVPVVDQVINPVISQTMAPVPEASVNPMQVLVFVASVVWLVGTAVMLAYLAISYLRVYRRVRESVPVEKGVRCYDGIPGAFVLGVLRPRIYLSSSLSREDLPYVLAHERAHLRRGDHVWKLLGFLLLSVYWFHPLLWVAYVLLCRDMEAACDERVLKQLGAHAKKPYATALLNCAEPRGKSRVQHCPVAFGETKMKERVMNVLHYKQPKLWVSVIAVALIAATAVCFLTNPVSADEPDDPITPPNTQETTDTEQPTEEVTTEQDHNTEDVIDEPYEDKVFVPTDTMMLFDTFDNIKGFFTVYRESNSGTMVVIDPTKLDGKATQWVGCWTTFQADDLLDGIYINPRFSARIMVPGNSSKTFQTIYIFSSPLTQDHQISANDFSSATWQRQNRENASVIGWDLLHDGILILKINFDADTSEEDMLYWLQELKKGIVVLEY